MSPEEIADLYTSKEWDEFCGRTNPKATIPWTLEEENLFIELEAKGDYVSDMTFANAGMDYAHEQDAKYLRFHAASHLPGWKPSESQIAGSLQSKNPRFSIIGNGKLIVEIKTSGEVTLGKDVTAEFAAHEFWKAVDAEGCQYEHRMNALIQENKDLIQLIMNQI
jgi:hypothetical protein